MPPPRRRRAHAHPPTRAMTTPGRTLDEQMLADWASVGLRKLEAHLARHAAFCEFLRDRRDDRDEREEPCPHPHAR